jgi:hypothetical protein
MMPWRSFIPMECGEEHLSGSAADGWRCRWLYAITAVAGPPPRSSSGLKRRAIESPTVPRATPYALYEGSRMDIQSRV